MANDALKVLLDGTPLLGPRTGIGRYTVSLSEELASFPRVDTRAVAFTVRGWRTLRTVLPPGIRARGIPVPARVLRRCWLRGSFPPVELFAGPTEVVHGTNFMLPGSVKAAGVLTIHDLSFLDAPEELSARDATLPDLVRAGARRAKAICTPTAAVADAVAERLDVDRDKIMVTPLGVDPAWFTALPPNNNVRSRFGLPSEYLLYVGTSGPRKGLDWLRTAHRDDPELPPLIFIGPGPFVVNDRSQDAGYLSDVDLRSVVAGASALVLPSRDEGFGLPVLEAMACDVPVVCTDVPSLREVAGKFAHLVQHGDVDGLTQALGTAIAERHDPSSSIARRAHAASFTWHRCAEATVDAYQLATGRAS